ncbi:hypothetical protein [Acetobacter cibinongensis]|uniref:Uncharacterized protein n=1 Tax=Acetobacter cibinongensis TaxID=146475 RepID=A0A1Z5YRN8_9PROT|nr:hypothetical protein [Acetobacter cibinongensis]OUI99549.1 hypothetical protein HK14_14235 [Acetobacter cibinongensis]
MSHAAKEIIATARSLRETARLSRATGPNDADDNLSLCEWMEQQAARLEGALTLLDGVGHQFGPVIIDAEFVEVRA